jgi:hypothetical protein
MIQFHSLLPSEHGDIYCRIFVIYVSTRDDFDVPPRGRLHEMHEISASFALTRARSTSDSSNSPHMRTTSTKVLCSMYLQLWQLKSQLNKTGQLHCQRSLPPKPTRVAPLNATTPHTFSSPQWPSVTPDSNSWQQY